MQPPKGEGDDAGVNPIAGPAVGGLVLGPCPSGACASQVGDWPCSGDEGTIGSPYDGDGPRDVGGDIGDGGKIVGCGAPWLGDGVVVGGSICVDGEGAIDLRGVDGCSTGGKGGGGGIVTTCGVGDGGEEFVWVQYLLKNWSKWIRLKSILSWTCSSDQSPL